MGISSLIPKGDKPKDKLSNWRPITLLNTVYKLISGVLANRISTLLPKLINSDQSGFVKGHYIGEWLITMYIWHFRVDKEQTKDRSPVIDRFWKSLR